MLYSQNFMDPEEGYRKYIDVDSWVNWYLVQETLCNKDTNYYFFKKNAQPDTKLGMSPVWDFEWSLGIGWNYTEPARHDVLVQRSLYFDRLMQDPYFAGQLHEVEHPQHAGQRRSHHAGNLGKRSAVRQGLPNPPRAVAGLGDSDLVSIFRPITQKAPECP